MRLPGYDYSQAGAYFVTVVTWRRKYLFGNAVNSAITTLFPQKSHAALAQNFIVENHFRRRACHALTNMQGQ